MTLENCIIETTYEYIKDEDGDDRYDRGSKQDFLVVKFPIPGGQAIFKFKISSEQSGALDKASKLSKE